MQFSIKVNQIGTLTEALDTVRDGAESRLQNDCITPFGENSGYLDSRSCRSSSRGRSNQDRSAM